MGDRVHRGGLLARLDPIDYELQEEQAAVAQARAASDSAAPQREAAEKQLELAVPEALISGIEQGDPMTVTLQHFLGLHGRS